VWLAAEPPQSSDESYSVHFEWGGSDPDGKILRYEYLLTENERMIDPADVAGDWIPLSGTDSTFVFATDPPATDSPARASAVRSSQTFFVRAVDNELQSSPQPDYISFTGRGLIPGVRITVPEANLGITPASVPPVSTFEWDRHLELPEPDSVQFALVNTNQHNGSYAETIDYLRSFDSASEWYPWVWFGASAGKGKSWTTPSLDLGNYVFAIRAKNVVNAMNPVLQEPVNVRRVRVVPDTAAPVLVVQHPHFGYIIGASCDFPLTIVPLAAHLPIAFTFAACAGHYGGTVMGYRYGWDILDLDDPDQWEMDYTPFTGPFVVTPAREFSFGAHVFSVEVIDNLDHCSRIQVKVNIVRFTGERNLLIVDDYRPDETAQSGWALTNGALPSDAEHDGFWLDMVSDVDQFDPALDMIATSTNHDIPFATLARYKTIVWSAYSNVDTRNQSDLPFLYRYIYYRANRLPQNLQGTCSPTGGVIGEVPTNAIAAAIESGVHVLITGNHPVQNVVPRTGTFMVRWPVIPLYELEPGSSQFGTQPTYLVDRPGRFGFAHRDLCLEAVDYGFQTSQRARVAGSGSTHRYCPVNGFRTPNTSSRRDDTMREGTPLDPNFPAISLRPEVAATGKVYQASQQGLDVEVYNPAYFRQGAACEFVMEPRSCFEPIYGLVGLDTAELTYHQPVAFWTGAYADVVAEDIPGAVAARSAVFGFPPVYFDPGQVKPGIEYILFDEWQLPRSPLSLRAERGTAANP
jgi:hypothetical protein